MPKFDGTGPNGKGPITGFGEGNCRSGRPRQNRCIDFDPQVTYFKPQGVPINQLDIIEVSLEEIEALRLKNISQLDQADCANKMQTSQSTFQRILSSAYSKITQALVDGKAIRIIKENKQ